MNAFSTVVTADHFQFFIPLWAYCLSRAYPECRLGVWVRGRPNLDVLAALDLVPNLNSYWGQWEDFPNMASTTNCLRFTQDLCGAADQCIIMDVDLLVFPTEPDLWHWHNQRLHNGIAAHRGPIKKPYRPEVTGEDGWTGDWARVAGGYVMVTPAWIRRTAAIRSAWTKKLWDGNWGDFREADEVMLARMIREAGQPLPAGGFPDDLRGLHLGDFKDSMAHRFTDAQKMRRRVSDLLVAQYRLMAQTDQTWKRIVELCIIDPVVATIMERVDNYMEERCSTTRSI